MVNSSTIGLLVNSYKKSTLQLLETKIMNARRKPTWVFVTHTTPQYSKLKSVDKAFAGEHRVLFPELIISHMDMHININVL